MTKSQLLEKVSQVDIIKKYFPPFDATLKKNYHSPFGDKDNKPSLSIYKSGNDWKFKSHNTGHGGDVFQFVADLKHIDCKAEFDRVIDLIGEDFSLNGFAKNKKQSISITFEKAPAIQMIKYFERFKIDSDTLKRFNVNQVMYHEFISSNGKHCKFDYSHLKQIAICYTIDSHIKVYFPKIEGVQEKGFGYKDQRSDEIFGWDQLLPCETVFIAAGEKDCLSLNSNGFSAISFQSENYTPTDSQIKIIQGKAKNIFVVYDNDKAGKNASAKLCKFNKWTNISLPQGINDVADFFSLHDKFAFQKLVDNQIKITPHDSNSYTIFHQTENYLNDHYQLRLNTISLEIEVAEKDCNEFRQLNENDLFIELNKKGIKVSMDKLIAVLKSSFVKKFNPIREYFTSLEAWNEKTNYIRELAEHLHCEEQEELIEQFTKWLVRAVCGFFERGFYNKQAFILVSAKQNSGKTTFCRFICPPALKNYFAENISVDKDSRITIAKNAFINLDELSYLEKRDVNALKALFSKDIVNDRFPYDRKTTIIPRTASFIGSTNMTEFLTDETGSVRWLCFEIKSIDWNYKKNIDINKVFAQAYHLYRSGYECEMNANDIQKNEKRNSKFQQLSAEAEIIPMYLKPAEENTPGAEFLSATDIMMYLSFTNIRLNKVMIGKAMLLSGFKRAKNSLTDRYGYWCYKVERS